METVTVFYILNASLLLLHEMESAFEKEWEILRFPGHITGFLLLHIPIIILLFYGALEIEKYSQVGIIIGVISACGGVIPFMVHKILVKRKDRFNLPLSHILIYGNLLSGIILLMLSVRCLV